MSMCLVRGLIRPEDAIRIALWLSQNRMVGSEIGIVISEIRDRNQSSSRAASEAAMYSASVDERAMRGCFRELQLIAPPQNKKVFPEIECLWAWEPQSASV